MENRIGFIEDVSDVLLDPFVKGYEIECLVELALLDGLVDFELKR